MLDDRNDDTGITASVGSSDLSASGNRITVRAYSEAAFEFTSF